MCQVLDCMPHSPFEISNSNIPILWMRKLVWEDISNCIWGVLGMQPDTKYSLRCELTILSSLLLLLLCLWSQGYRTDRKPLSSSLLIREWIPLHVQVVCLSTSKPNSISHHRKESWGRPEPMYYWVVATEFVPCRYQVSCSRGSWGWNKWPKALKISEAGRIGSGAGAWCKWTTHFV